METCPKTCKVDMETMSKITEGWLIQKCICYIISPVRTLPTKTNKNEYILVETNRWFAVGLKVALTYAWLSLKNASTTNDTPKIKYPFQLCEGSKWLWPLFFCS